MVTRIALALAASLGLACCASTDDVFVSSPSFGPVQEFNAESDTLDGIWQSRGYGWIFEIEGAQLSQYQIAGDICFLTPDDSKSVSETLSLDYRFYRQSDSGQEAVLQLLPDDTEIRIVRIDELPSGCVTPTQPSKSQTFDYFAAMMAEHYAFFDERQIDWDNRVERARLMLDEAMTEPALFDLLASMIDGFSDSHTKLFASINDKRLRQQDGLGPTLSRLRAAEQETPWIIGLFTGLQTDVLDEGSVHTANDRILWGTIDGRIGYIQMLVMGGFSGLDISDPGFRKAELEALDAVLDEALTEMVDTDFVIVDLSNNRGGYDAISRALISRFAEADTVAYQTTVPGSGIAARPRLARTQSSARSTRPVLLLTSDVTVSGGELATLGLTSLPNVTHMGGTTRGSFSTVLAKPLPNGWVVELSNEIIANPDGVVFERIGIEPEVELNMFPADDPIAGYFAALNEAIQVMDALLRE